MGVEQKNSRVGRVKIFSRKRFPSDEVKPFSTEYFYMEKTKKTKV